MGHVACFLNSFNWKLYPEIRSKWIFMPTALETRKNVVHVLKIRLWSKNKLTGNGGGYRESESPHLLPRTLPYLSYVLLKDPSLPRESALLAAPAEEELRRAIAESDGCVPDE